MIRKSGITITWCTYSHFPLNFNIFSPEQFMATRPKKIVSLTKCPANSHTVDDWSKHDTCSISCIVINQLEQVHSPLWITKQCHCDACWVDIYSCCLWDWCRYSCLAYPQFKCQMPNTSVMNKICTRNNMEQKMTRKISLRQGLRICPGKRSIIADVIVSRPENWHINPC